MHELPGTRFGITVGIRVSVGVALRANSGSQCRVRVSAENYISTSSRKHPDLITVRNNLGVEQVLQTEDFRRKVQLHARDPHHLLPVPADAG